MSYPDPGPVSPVDVPAPGATPGLLRGVSAWVTGGGRGLGRAYATALAEASARVLITGRNEATLRETAGQLCAGGGDVTWAVADVLDPTATMEVVSSFGYVDVLVANAGVPGPTGPTWTLEGDEWWRTLEVNLRGTAISAHAVLPGMVARGRGLVIAVVSNAGRHRWPTASAYSVSKAAQIMLIENLDGELRDTGVGAVCIDPGLVYEGMTRTLLEIGHFDNPWLNRVLEWTKEIQRRGGFASVDATRAELIALVTEHLTTTAQRDGGHTDHSRV